MRYEDRVDAVQTKLDEIPAVALLVSNLTNVRYLCGFSGTNGQLLITGTSATFLTDPRYEARAASLVQGPDVAIYATRLSERLTELLPAGALAVEGATMTLEEKAELARTLGDQEIIVSSGVIEGLRRVKDDEEIALLREAVKLSDDAFTSVSSQLRPGMTERGIALELEIHMRKAGAESASFDPIVGSGPLSAHIHHSPSDRPIEKGDLVLMDLGSRFEGYCSDLTRTVVMGPPTELQRELYEIVLSAQQAAVDATEAGMPGKEVDAAARDLIKEAGYGDRFNHGTGHGVGLDIHEAPRLHFASKDDLVVGDVVTVEPGIYIPGSGGVRIEDCVLVTEDGREVLGGANKQELISL